jgi:UDP-GlcNAc3NAcA epimerase
LREFNIDEYLVHSGQYFDDNMSQVFFDDMKIKQPDAYLGISGGSHGSMTGQMLIKIEELITLFSEIDDFVIFCDINL